MAEMTMTLHLGLLCGDAVQAIKFAAVQWGVTCEHAKGHGWLSANHVFRFTHADKTWLDGFQNAMRNFINQNQG